MIDPNAPTGTGEKVGLFGDLSRYLIRDAGGVRFERSDDFALTEPPKDGPVIRTLEGRSFYPRSEHSSIPSASHGVRSRNMQSKHSARILENDPDKVSRSVVRETSEALAGHSILEVQRTAGNQAVARLIANRNSPLQREVSEEYGYIRKKLERGLLDWAVTDKDCLRVIRQLDYLSDGDLLDTYNKMQADGLWTTLMEQAPRSEMAWFQLRRRLSKLGQPVLWGDAKSDEGMNLARLKSALSASKRGMQAAGAVTSDPALKSYMSMAADRFGLATDTLGKGMEVDAAAKGIYKLSKAAIALDGIDVMDDPEGAAAAFDSLFSAAGDLGSMLPPGPWSPYFSFLSGFDGFFANMQQKMDPKNRGGGRFRKYM